WLFRIAHNRALDVLRRHDQRLRAPLDETIADDALDPEDATARDEAVRAAVSRFLALAPAERSCVILKDVLGHSLDQIAALLELTIPAVKAALHRGRVRLAAAAAAPHGPRSPAVERYARLFNARDWDGVRATLAEDVRLNLLQRAQKSGRQAVGRYFTNYGSIEGWRLEPAWLDGREVLAVFLDGPRPAYFIEVVAAGD